MLATDAKRSARAGRGHPGDRAFGIAQKKGLLLVAMDQYRLCSAVQCPRAVRDDCTAGLDGVTRALPSVTIAVRDRSGNDIGVAIALDGRIIPRGRAVDVDPGHHALSYTIGGVTRQHEFVAHEGEKSRPIVVTDEPTSNASETGSRATVHLVGPIVTGVLGAALVTYGVASYLGYASKEDRLQRMFNEACQPPGDTDPACSPSQSEAQRRARDEYDANEDDASERAPFVMTGTVFGALAIAGAITWFILTTPKSKPTSGSLFPVIAPPIGSRASSWGFGGTF